MLNISNTLQQCGGGGIHDIRKMGEERSESLIYTKISFRTVRTRLCVKSANRWPLQYVVLAKLYNWILENRINKKMSSIIIKGLGTLLST